jgi:hypothetical protein
MIWGGGTGDRERRECKQMNLICFTFDSLNISLEMDKNTSTLLGPNYKHTKTPTIYLQMMNISKKVR